MSNHKNVIVVSSSSDGETDGESSTDHHSNSSRCVAVSSSSDGESSTDDHSNSSRCVVVSSSSDGEVDESSASSYKKPSCWGVSQTFSARKSFLCENDLDRQIDPMYLDSFGTDLRHRKTPGRPPKTPYWALAEKEGDDQPLPKINRAYTEQEVKEFMMELEAERKALGIKRGRPRKCPDAVRREPKPPLLDENGRIIKRPRGRPRTKEPKPVVLNELGEVIRKPRGRPRLHDSSVKRPLKPPMYNEAGELVRRPRGRPRTRVLDPNRVIRPRGRPPKNINPAKDQSPSQTEGSACKLSIQTDLEPKTPKKRGRKTDYDKLVEAMEGARYTGRRLKQLFANKPKVIFTFDQKFDGKTITDGEMKEMIDSGVPVVDVTDPEHVIVKEEVKPEVEVNTEPVQTQQSDCSKQTKPPKELKQTDDEKKRGKEKVSQQKKIVALKQAKKITLLPKKSRGRRRKEFEFAEIETQPPEQNTIINKPEVLEKLCTVYRGSHYVPAYKCRAVVSCEYCQQWSWDVKQCQNCFRRFPANQKSLIVEEHEVLSEAMDTSRPFYHSPPVPYFKPGKVVLCSGCFYFTPYNLPKCTECETEVPHNAECFYIDFDNNPNFKESLGAQVIEFKPRLVESSLVECPHCSLTCLTVHNHCRHCKEHIPTSITVVPLKRKDAAVSVPRWPSLDMLIKHELKLPPDYVPIFREQTVTMCRWCCTWVWDLNRCSSCLRKLPPTSDLLMDGPGHDFVDGKAAERPAFSPKPHPYLRPGLADLCLVCGEYSKNSKRCDSCGSNHFEMASYDVCFDLAPVRSGIKLPFQPRTVNTTYAVCPHCEFSTNNWKVCTHCCKPIPENVTVVVTREKKDLKPPNLNKPASVFTSLTLATLTGAKRPELPKYKLNSNYVPRYREKGIAQCISCLAWTWDMNRCSFCYSKVPCNDKLLVIYPKPGALRIRDIEEFRPQFDKEPSPYLKPGKLVLCKCCYCYVSGPPFCTSCGKALEIDPEYYILDFSWFVTKTEPQTGSHMLPYAMRYTEDRNLALCPFCGFTTEDFKNCSYCHHDIPDFVLIYPEVQAKPNPPQSEFLTTVSWLEEKPQASKKVTPEKPKSSVLILKPVPAPAVPPEKVIKIVTPIKMPVKTPLPPVTPVNTSISKDMVGEAKPGVQATETMEMLKVINSYCEKMFPVGINYKEFKADNVAIAMHNDPRYENFQKKLLDAGLLNSTS